MILLFFIKNGTNEELKCTIIRITLYQSVKNLLTLEDITKTLSSDGNLEQGIKSIESISDYKEQRMEYLQLFHLIIYINVLHLHIFLAS